MRRLTRISLGLLGLAVVAPRGVEAQVATASLPSGYSMSAPAASPAPAPAPAVEAPHKHKGKTLCAKCAAKLQAQSGMAPGTIVRCEHLSKGVCPACQAALNAPGPFVVAGAAPVEAPGRAVASSGMSPAAGASARQPAQPYDDGMGEPAPVGVVQAGFAPAGSTAMGSPAGYAAQMPSANMPGHAVAESNAGNDPYQKKSGIFPHPHIIRHLLLFKDVRAEKAEAKAQLKSEAHAKMTFEENGTAPVEDLPASKVFGKQR